MTETEAGNSNVVESSLKMKDSNITQQSSLIILYLLLSALD